MRNGRRCVYIVEDDIELSTVLDRVLKSIDPEIHLDWATNAEDATQTLAALANAQGNDRPFDLIIADIFLEGQQTGLDLLRTCQNNYPKIPVVVTSGEGFERFLNAIDVHAPCPPFLHKPFSIDTCRQLFERLLFPERKVA